MGPLRKARSEVANEQEQTEMSDTNTEFTAQQLADWKRYEHVRQDGSWNMIADPRAREATGLGRERYMFVLVHYSELAEAIKSNRK